MELSRGFARAFPWETAATSWLVLVRLVLCLTCAQSRLDVRYSTNQTLLQLKNLESCYGRFPMPRVDFMLPQMAVNLRHLTNKCWWHLRSSSRFSYIAPVGRIDGIMRGIMRGSASGLDKSVLARITYDACKHKHQGSGSWYNTRRWSSCLRDTIRPDASLEIKISASNPTGLFQPYGIPRDAWSNRLFQFSRLVIEST